MPKKGKVNKLARMTDEERAKYLQHRADMEEEARRKKQELIAMFIKNKLDKEETYSKINTAKLNQEWRYILRKIKCSQMHLEIQGLMNSFSFLIERKDRLINTLMRATDDSDEQHRRAFQAHTETLSYFISIGSQRLDKLQTEYNHRKNALLENWDKEEIDISDSQERAEFKLILITYIQDRDFKNYNKGKEYERATSKNDARLEHEEEMRSLCKPKQLEIEMYWSKLRDVYNSYLETHNPIMAHYNALKEKDDFYQRDRARNEVLIQRSCEVLLNLQKQWMRTTNTMSSKIKRMNTHKEDLTNRYMQLKKESKLERNRANEQLTLMVDLTSEAIKRLENLKEKLNKIMLLANICSKYENDDDKAEVTEYEMIEDSPIDYENLDGDMINECKEYKKMDKFMLKMNRVKVQVLCLKAEKAKLIKENLQLKHYFKRYLTELALKGNKSRPGSVNLQANVEKTRSTGKKNRPVTCIEGALSNAVLHEKRMKLYEQRKKEIGGIRSYPRMQCWMKTG